MYRSLKLIKAFYKLINAHSIQVSSITVKYYLLIMIVVVLVILLNFILEKLFQHVTGYPMDSFAHVFLVITQNNRHNNTIWKFFRRFISTHYLHIIMVANLYLS